MNTLGASTPAHGSDLCTRYERLRDSALGKVVTGIREPGLALLMRRGVRAWLEALSETIPDEPTPLAGRDAPLAMDVRGELVRVVVMMALGATHQEARS